MGSAAHSQAIITVATEAMPHLHRGELSSCELLESDAVSNCSERSHWRSSSGSSTSMLHGRARCLMDNRCSYAAGTAYAYKLRPAFPAHSILITMSERQC